MTRNVDIAVVDGFGDEWSRLDQSDLSESEAEELFNQYFDVFPWNALPATAMGIDFGCGSGRWARLVAPRVGRLLCFDASPAAAGVARRGLAPPSNVEVSLGALGEVPLAH